jgi:2'-5' RNA ligase
MRPLALPLAAPSAAAAAIASERRIVTLTQPASRAVASYAGTAAALQAQQARTSGQLQPGVMTSPEKQFPAMPTISRKTPYLESMGAPGTAIFQGIITNDDYNPDFYWRDAIEIYDQMCRNDGQIMAIVQQLELPIRRATWTVEPFSDAPRDKEIASFIESCLFHDLVRTTADGQRVYQKWDDILRHVLMMLRYGFAAFEKVWRVEDGWVKLAHLMPLLPMSVYRWWVGQDNELVGIQQYTFKNYTYCFVDIPAAKLLTFHHRMEGQNYQGFSLLRAAYKHWYYKDQFYKIDAIGLERNAIAVPEIHLPPSFTSEDVSTAQSILANLRANESMGVTLPPNWTINYIAGSEHYAGHALKSIEHHDVMIARSVLAQFLNLGSAETGAYALATDQRQDLLESLQAESEYIEDVFSADLIPQLVDFNFADVEGYPRIKCSKLAQADIVELTDAISKLKARDANFLTPDPELEDWVRDQFGMPKASKSAIAAANPTAPTTPGRPNAQPGQPSDHADAESAPVVGKKAPVAEDASGESGAQASAVDAGVALADLPVKHSGVMVALQVPEQVAKRLAWPGGEPASDLHITLAFLGDASDLSPRQCARLKRIVSDYAADSLPIRANLAGVGSFPPGPHSEGKRPIYADVANAGLPMWRQGLVDRLKGAGLPVDETFKDYHPHITLAYIPADAPLPKRGIPRTGFWLGKVICAIGDEQTSYDMGAEQGVMVSAEDSDLLIETRALREALATIAGLDATERGMQSAERLDAMLLFNPNHQPAGPGGGEFAPGGGSGGGGGGSAKGSGGGGSKAGSPKGGSSSAHAAGAGASSGASTGSGSYSSHHWEAKSGWGNWSSEHKGMTATVDAKDGKATLTVKHGNGKTEVHTIEADHEYGGYKATNHSTGEVEHGMTLKGANDYAKSEIGHPMSTHGTALLKGGNIFDSTMLEAPGAKPNAAQKALNKANDAKVVAQKQFDYATAHGAKAVPVWSNGSKTVEYHKPDGSMVRVSRNPDDTTYTVETFKAKANATVTPAESWLASKDALTGEHSYEDKPSSTKVYKTEKGVQNVLAKEDVNQPFASSHLTLHNPSTAPSHSATATSATSATSTLSPHSTKGWTASMAANLSGGKVIAEGEPSPGTYGIGKYDIKVGATTVRITAIGNGSEEVHLRYSKPGGKVEEVKAYNAAEAKADLAAHGIKDPQAHVFVDMARHDMDTYSVKATPEQQVRIAHVNARRATLDAKFGAYSDAAARAEVQKVYKAYPGLRGALTAHLTGGSHLQESSIAGKNSSKSLSKPEKLAQAKEGLAKLHEVSEWSLLHQPNVTREGTIRLFHGTNGKSDASVWKQRLESSASRRGTPMTDRWSVARSFSDHGKHGSLIVSAHVPVEAISVWHGIRGDSQYAHEREYTLGTGAIHDSSIINLENL